MRTVLMPGHALAAVSAVAVLMLGLGGCGGDESTSPASPTTVTATVTESGALTETATPSGTATGSVTTSTPTLNPPTESATPAIDLSQPPRTYDAAIAHFAAVGGPPVRVARFETESGNIYCAVGVSAIPPSCEISQGSVRDPAVCNGAPTPFVGRLEIFRGRARAICNTDTIRMASPAVVAYGTAVRGRGVKCLVEEIGVTCISTTSFEGFFLHRGEYVIFNAG